MGACAKAAGESQGSTSRGNSSSTRQLDVATSVGSDIGAKGSSGGDDHVAAVAAVGGVGAGALSGGDDHLTSLVFGSGSLTRNEVDVTPVAGVAGADGQLDVAARALARDPARDLHLARVAGSRSARGEHHGAAHSSSARIGRGHGHRTAARGLALPADHVQAASRGVGGSSRGEREAPSHARGSRGLSSGDRDLTPVAGVTLSHLDGDVASSSVGGRAGGKRRRSRLSVGRAPCFEHKVATATHVPAGF